MNNECLIVQDIDKTTTKLTLNRPEKHNALNLELMSALSEALMKIEKSACRIVLMNASGKDFCAGLDLQQASDESLIEKMGRQLATLFTIMHNTSLVTIACVHGNAIAGGGGIAASCDIVLMTEDAKIGFPETRRGLIAAQVAAILCRQINMRAMKELLLTGTLIDSYRAVEMGLANRVVIQDNIEKEALIMAGEISKGAPGAIKDTKRLLERLSLGNFSEDLEHALTIHHASRNSPEGKEGVAAFLQKRPPRWD